MIPPFGAPGAQIDKKPEKAAIDAGYAERLLPSHDGGVTWSLASSSSQAQEERKKANPYGWLYLKKVVFPQLAEMGVPKATINRLCVDNPRRFFEGA